MPRKTQDPKLIALMDQRDKAQQDFAKAYSRFRRATGRMHKALGRIKRLTRQIDNFDAQKGSANHVHH